MKKFLFTMSFFACLFFMAGCSDDNKSDGSVENNGEDKSTEEKNGEEPTVAKDELNILCFGNSFTQDAVEQLPQITEAAGLDKVRIVFMYYAARTLPEFYEGYYSTNDYACYTMDFGGTKWTSQSGMTLHDAAMLCDYDYVTLQEHTGSHYAWIWNDVEKNAIEGLIDYIKGDQGDNVPKFYYIMTQAYTDLSKVVAASKEYVSFSTTDEMYDVIVAQAKRVFNLSSVYGVISTGTMLQNLRTTSLNNDMGLTRDGYHLDWGLSRYGAACTVFETLISPKFGIKLDDNSFRRSDFSSDHSWDASWPTTPITDETQPIALQAARYAIDDPFKVTDMSEY